MFAVEHTFSFNSTSIEEMNKALLFIESLDPKNRYDLVVENDHMLKLKVSYNRTHKTISQWIPELPEMVKEFCRDGKDHTGEFIGTSDPDERDGYTVSLNTTSFSDEHILITPSYWICSQ